MAGAALAGGPAATIDSPGSLTNDPTPTFTWHTSTAASGFVCQIDGQDVACGCSRRKALKRGCGSQGSYTSFALADGSHRFRVQPVDPGSSPGQLDFVVDTV